MNVTLGNKIDACSTGTYGDNSNLFLINDLNHSDTAQFHNSQDKYYAFKTHFKTFSVFFAPRDNLTLNILMILIKDPRYYIHLLIS